MVALFYKFFHMRINVIENTWNILLLSATCYHCGIGTKPISIIIKNKEN